MKTQNDRIMKLLLNTTCAVCNKKVDKCGYENDFRTCRMIFWVECHGEHERVYFDQDIIHKIVSPPQPGIAFDYKNRIK